MACPVIQTGAQFLSTTLFSIDCHARAIGGYGYGALADPASSVSYALTGLVTIFIALFGIKLLFDPTSGTRDVVGDIIRIGLVLTIATSWPAWRTVAYDLVLDGPVEIAQAIGARAGLPGSSNGIMRRLQDVDDGIVVVTMYGSGRLTGGVSAGADLGDATSGIAVSDGIALGLGRTAFLVSTIGGFAIVRLCAGILLAIAPLMAGLALFTGTLGVFIGWLRALAFCALGSIMLLVVEGAMTAMLFPWLTGVLKLRKDNVLTPSAPTEILALTLGFAVLTAGALFLVAKLTFFPLISRSARLVEQQFKSRDRPVLHSNTHPKADAERQLSGAQALANAVTVSMRRESRTDPPRTTEATLTPAPLTAGGETKRATPQLIGDSFRRSYRRTSAVADRRNRIG